MKWWAETTRVDLETGEILKIEQILNKDYREVITEKKIEIINEKNGKIKYTVQCRRHEQHKLEL